MIEPAKSSEIRYAANSSSKYREIITSVIEYMRTHPSDHIVKIKFATGAEAERVAKKCKLWLEEDEVLYVSKKGREVFFMNVIPDAEEED